MNIHLNLEIPANQTVVTELFVELTQIDSPVMQRVTGPTNTIRCASLAFVARRWGLRG